MFSSCSPLEIQSSSELAMPNVQSAYACAILMHIVTKPHEPLPFLNAIARSPA